MSWHFSQVLEAAYSEENFWDGEPSAQWKSIPSAPDDSCSGKMKATFHRSPFGTMFVPSTDARGATILTWFLAVFRVRTPQQPAKEQDSRASGVVCGLNLPASLTKYDLGSHSWKTRLSSESVGWTEFSPTLPKSGTMRNGLCWEQTTLEHFITGNECGYLPTPDTQDTRNRLPGNPVETKNRTVRHLNKKGTQSQLRLSQALRYWLPIIGANEYKGSSRARYVTSEFFRGAKMSEGWRTCETDPIYLSPSFGELMMGWPIMWTASTPLETDKFRLWLRQHGISCMPEYTVPHNMPATDYLQELG
jgi:hypothetical protein